MVGYSHGQARLEYQEQVFSQVSVRSSVICSSPMRSVRLDAGRWCSTHKVGVHRALRVAWDATHVKPACIIVVNATCGFQSVRCNAPPCLERRPPQRHKSEVFTFHSFAIRHTHDFNLSQY